MNLASILSALQNGVTAINNLSNQIARTFPQATTASSIPPTGTITFTSSQAAGFMSVTTSSGATYVVPVYTP